LLAVAAVGGVLLAALRSPEVSGDVAAATEADSPVESVHRYDAIGDSITFGDEIEFTVDRSGYPKKIDVTFQGWPGLLGYILTRETGVNTVVSNGGHPGDRTTRARKKNLPALLQRNSGFDRALLLLGTNDSGEFRTTPSGEGCSGDACSDTFKGDLLAIISSLKDAGRNAVYVALIPPIWGPDDDTLYRDPLAYAAKLNRRIAGYNRVIRNEIAIQPGVKQGPDFFSCFLAPGVNRFSLFKDRLHPNRLGYVMMAALWRDAIISDSRVAPADLCPSPVYVLESLDPYVHGHKQNLLQAGDQYYTDEPFTLTNIPSELTDGIWVSQANADRDNDDASFLNFDSGESPVTVYIAYDPAGSPPLSLSHEFASLTLSSDLKTSDSSLRAFSIVKASGVTGMVSIGGNRSGSDAGAQQAYVVIVVP
jgi:lysophospholipase L1-like esterase